MFLNNIFIKELNEVRLPNNAKSRRNVLCILTSNCACVPVMPRCRYISISCHGLQTTTCKQRGKQRPDMFTLPRSLERVHKNGKILMLITNAKAFSGLHIDTATGRQKVKHTRNFCRSQDSKENRERADKNFKSV